MKKMLIILFVTSYIQAIEVVDMYIDRNETEKAINRLYYLAKDMRNFTCTQNYMNCLTPRDILDRVTKIRDTSQNNIEKTIINRFIKEDEVQKNIFMRSHTLFKDKRYDETLIELKTILLNYPKNIYTLTYLAKTALLIDNPKISEYCYKKLIKYRPEISDSYFELTEIYIQDKNYSIAQTSLDTAKEIFPDDSRIKIYQNKIDKATSFWSNIFGSDDE